MTPADGVSTDKRTTAAGDRTSERLALRKDLQWVRRTIRGQGRWIVRDPLTTDFYYFSDVEKNLLDQLDATRTVGEWINDSDLTCSVSAKWKAKLLGHALQHQLLIGNQPGHARRLAALAQRSRHRARRALPFQVLAIKIPVFDPTPLLNRTRGVGRVIFSRASLFGLLISGIILLALVVGRWEAVAYRLPDWQAMLSGDRVFFLLVAYVAMKAIHELSHALACRRWGAECHEVGLFILAFTPCLYCDVSDIWRVSEKFPRVMVAAAGVFSELAMAIAAGFIWFFTVEGPLNLIAFNVMVLGSVSTLLVNANPLLRYDGYYMLADAIEVPNLAEQSREATWGPLKSWLSAGHLVPTPRDASFALLFTYGIASLIYRSFVLVLILWGINRMFAQWDLEIVAGILTTTIVVGVVLSMITSTRMGLTQIISSGPIQWLRFAVLGSVLATIIYGAIAFPLPHWVAAVGQVKPQLLEPVFVSRSGFLEEALAVNSRVRIGDTIAQLRWPEEEYRLAALTAEIAELEKEIQGTRLRLNDEPNLVSSLEVMLESEQDKRQQLVALKRQERRLTLTARTDGTLIEPVWDVNPQQPETALRNWQGNPLDAVNRQAWFEQGTLLGWVADLDDFRAEAFVGESDVLQIAVGAVARVRLDRNPSDELAGKITRIDLQPVVEIPHSLQGDPRLPVRSDRGRGVRTEESTYRVIIQLDSPLQDVSSEAVATVRVEASTKSLFQRLVRYLRRTFRGDATF